MADEDIFQKKIDLKKERMDDWAYFD